MSDQKPQSTPGAEWRAYGEADPHRDRYECERAQLTMGNTTDDALANGAFLNYDQPLNIHGIMAGTHFSPIAWMTAVKDRIRWLSRQNEALLQENANLRNGSDAAAIRNAALEEAAIHISSGGVEWPTWADPTDAAEVFSESVRGLKSTITLGSSE